MVLFNKPSQAVVQAAKPESQVTLSTGGMSLVLSKPASSALAAPATTVPPPSTSAPTVAPSESTGGATKPPGMMAPPGLL